MTRTVLNVNGRPSDLWVDARDVENLEWCGRPALKLDGLAFLPAWELEAGSISVDLGSDGAAYCGVVFFGTILSTLSLSTPNRTRAGAGMRSSMTPSFTDPIPGSSTTVKGRKRPRQCRRASSSLYGWSLIARAPLSV